MRIHSLYLKNFKSYKELYLSPLNEELNVFLGKNGNGKSNLFQGKTENANEDVIVEATFENKSRRIPVEEDYLSLRRTWTSDNKDEYYMNGKVLTKNELNNVLESCGLSKSNPYNIIQQGKIHRMTHLSEDEIFNLLQEITGIKQFEEKKKESLKLLAETRRDKEKINELLSEVQKKIDELEAEKENYEDHEKKENSAKCLEFLLYQANVSELQDKLEKLGEGLRRSSEKYLDLKQEEASINSLISSRKANLAQLSALTTTLEEEDAKTGNEIEILETRLRIIQRNEREIEDQVSQSQGTQEDDPRGLEEQLEIQKKLVHDLRTRLEKISCTRDKLQLENYSASSFSSVKERNTFITQQLLGLEDHRKQTENNLDSNVKQIAEVEKERLQEQMNHKICTEKAANFKGKITEFNGELLELKRRRLAVNSEIKDHVHSINDFRLSLEECTKEKGEQKKKLDLLFRDSSFSAAARLYKEATKRGVNGVLGYFLEFIECPHELNFVLELLVKGRLFALIVDSSETANALIEINKELKGGPVTIFPLNWIRELKNKDRIYPKSQDVYKLIGTITLSPKGKTIEKEMNKLMENIFGKTILVKTYEMAMKLAKEHNFNCITMTGDIVFAGCYLSKVGFHNFENDSVKAFRSYSDLASRISELKSKIISETKAKDILSDEDVALCNSIRSFSSELIKSESDRAKAIAAAEESLRRVSGLELATAGLQELREKLLRDFESIKKQTEMFTEERTTKTLESPKQELLDQISLQKIEEENLRARLHKEHESYLAQLQSLNSLKLRISNKKLNSENSSLPSLPILRQECSMLQDQISKNLSKIAANKGTLAARKSMLESAEGEADAAEKRLADLRGAKDELEKKISETKQLRLQYIEQKNEFIVKKGNLELFQAEQLNKFSKFSNKELLSKLKELRISEKKKFTAKDRLLFERLETLREKSTSFEGKLKKISESETESLKLIEDLEGRAEETVNNVFASFKTFFEEYFLAIVPGGSTTMKKIRVPKELPSWISIS